MDNFNFQGQSQLLSPNQYKIADYIQKNAQLVLFSTEQEIADAIGVSIASVSRFWRSVGYRNMKDFKAKARGQLEVTPAAKMKNIMSKVQGHELQNIHNQFLQLTNEHLQETIEHSSPEVFEQAVQALVTASRIYVYGPGPSVGLAELLCYRMTRMGLSMHRIRNSGSELFEELMQITDKDMIVMFCFVRMLPEARVLLEHAKQAGYRTLIITDRLVSDISDQADLVLYASRGEIWEFHSMVAPTFLVENLIIRAGLVNEEFSLLKLDELSRLRKQYAKELPR